MHKRHDEYWIVKAGDFYLSNFDVERKMDLYGGLFGDEHQTVDLKTFAFNEKRSKAYHFDDEERAEWFAKVFNGDVLHFRVVQLAQ